MAKSFGLFQPNIEGSAGSYRWSVFTVEREGRLWVAFEHDERYPRPSRVGSYRSLREAHWSLTGQGPRQLAPFAS
ncbi:hypothetical protein QO011_008295 [Labrys wisconsinensis]|uniref:Uncharacterized protein n=1 Tax=Labrys wisconsinensis TaxID=425677 RepID=A0ABU0JLW1_9HYPH|nr:hypothetical protein [Labrys wisconsinensis]